MDGCWQSESRALRGPDPGTRQRPLPVGAEGEASTRPERRLLCRSCAAPIAREQDRIQVDGAHAHRFRNPQGIRFHIGCFAAARNCAPVGEATEAYTWFPGHAWRILLCAGCAAHLGWLFRARAGGCFYALILDRLASPH